MTPSPKWGLVYGDLHAVDCDRVAHELAKKFAHRHRAVDPHARRIDRRAAARKQQGVGPYGDVDVPVTAYAAQREVPDDL